MVVFHSHRLVDYLHIWTKGISELMSMAPMEARIMCLETIKNTATTRDSPDAS